MNNKNSGFIDKVNIVKYITLNLIGIIIFFIPVTIFGKNSILLDHMSTFITMLLKDFLKVYVILMMAVDVIYSLFSQHRYLAYFQQT